jgi:RNA polymerase sigma-70 factor (ECF subfamily)
MEQAGSMEQTDKSLIEAHLRGDPAALAMIVRQYGGSLLGYLRRMCGNRDEAEDLFQETFKKVHEKARTIRGENIRPWLFAVATRVAIDGMRRNKKLRFVSLNGDEDCDGPAATIADASSDPAGEALKAERREQVRGAIMELPERMRATLVMAYYEGLSYAEIAECMGCSVGTVKTQMFRAIQILADKLPDAAGDAV